MYQEYELESESLRFPLIENSGNDMILNVLKLRPLIKNCSTSIQYDIEEIAKRFSGKSRVVSKCLRLAEMPKFSSRHCLRDDCK